MSKLLNILLLVLIAVGTILLVRANQTGHRLKTEHNRLAAEFGALTVIDEDKFLVMFSGDQQSKRVFKWRVYQPKLPTGLQTRQTTIYGGSPVSSNLTSPRQFRIFISFRIKNEVPELYLENGIFGSSVQAFQEDIWSFLNKHWDDLNFEVMAESSPTEFATSEVLNVFSVRIPKRLFDELPKDLSDRRKKQLTTQPLFKFAMGETLVLESAK